MDTSSWIVAVPFVTLIALITGMALPFIADRRPGRSHERGADASLIEYLYVPCVRCDGYPVQARRWVQEVPVVRKTARLIYYTSDSWDPREAVVSPGCISREQFETDTRCHDDCPHGEDPCRHGYPAGVIPIPGDCHHAGPAGRLFFATREAAENHLYRTGRGLHRGGPERAGQAAPAGPSIKELRRAMADAHPDHGGTAEQFIQARRRYEAATGAA